MQVDPVTAAVVGALLTVVGMFYRHLLQEKAKCEAEVVDWRRRYFTAMGRTEVATDVVTQDES